MVVRKFISKMLKVAVDVVKIGCLTHCTMNYVVRPLRCDGPSMEPILRPDNIVISEQISPRLHRFDYGDIVVFKSPFSPKELICKRVIGLPGDNTSMRDKPVVPSGHLWLEGDNKENSYDSRYFGPIPQGLVVGRVICKIFPFEEITMLTIKYR